LGVKIHIKLTKLQKGAIIIISMYKVYNKFVDLSQSKLQWYILGLIGFFVVLIGLVTRDFLTVISSSIAFGIIYFGAVANRYWLGVWRRNL
jgi:hypothetical protein